MTTAAAVDEPKTKTASLTGSLAEVKDELRRADMKAAALMTVPLGVFAGTIALFARPLPLLAQVLLAAAAVPIAASALLLMATIMPYLGQGEPGSFIHAAECTPAELEELHDRGEQEAANRTATALQINAALAVRKHRRTRRAVQLLMAGVTTLFGALVVAGIQLSLG